jgi:YaaC-like Protein
LANLLPVEDVRFLFGEGRKAWLRVEISRGLLRQRGLRPEKLLTAARIFGSRFKLVRSETEAPTVSYESLRTFAYGKKRSEVVPDLCHEFDHTLIACDRSFPGAQRFIVLSARDKLLSHEAVTFAVLHHLSSVVRYRPDAAERLLRSRPAWLLTSWVDRACESLLLNIASRITGEEHVIA